MHKEEEQQLKYHSKRQMKNILENDIYETGEPFCNITIKLSEQVNIKRRRFTKLVEIWGNVGGYMEVILTLFKNIRYHLILELLNSFIETIN